MISSVIGSPRVRVDLATQPYRGFADDHREAARPLQRNGKRAVGRLRYPGVTPPLGTRPPLADSRAVLEGEGCGRKSRINPMHSAVSGSVFRLTTPQWSGKASSALCVAPIFRAQRVVPE